MGRNSRVVLSDDEVAEQVRTDKQGLKDSTIKRAVNKALAERREASASVQAAYDGAAAGRFETKAVAILDKDGKPMGGSAIYTIPKV